MKCDDCDSVTINGIPCHENGCPSDHINLLTGMKHEVICNWCDSYFEPDYKRQNCCDDDCYDAFYN